MSARDTFLVQSRSAGISQENLAIIVFEIDEDFRRVRFIPFADFQRGRFRGNLLFNNASVGLASDPVIVYIEVYEDANSRTG